MNIIKHRGTPHRAVLDNGKVVKRESRLYVPEWNTMVAVTPYDDHFIYATNEKGAAYKCTCGSSAVVIPPAPNGWFVCLLHAQSGKHQTSFVNKKDFGKSAGNTIEIAKR